MLSLLLAIAALAPQNGDALPVVTVTHDDTEVDRSCKIVVPKGTVIEDQSQDGVVLVAADGITLEFASGSVLRGSAPSLPFDQQEGIGIRIEGHHDVTVRGARCAGFRCGILARQADGLVLEDCDVSDGFAMRLGSTPAREDGADWLYPHHNDDREWLSHYGAGIWIETSKAPVVRRCRARRRQNGLILDSVDGGRVYDNDFSFLSGWGLAMWRSNDNVVSRNALDFCIRGYSDGVYNRGEDSAGLLMFEQCSRNVIAENSITHGGDGLFCFAGIEALGETEAVIDPTGRGCNANVFVRNDLSYAAAHGLELTFSFDNRISHNRLVENAICGVWGGYSQRTTIDGNEFARNGEHGYGLERGGVDIEHGAFNRIEKNTFTGDAVGVHLWWDDDGDLLKKPWAIANHKGAVDNTVADNRFEGTPIGVQLRDTERTEVFSNEWQDVPEPLATEGKADPIRTAPEDHAEIPPLALPELPGDSRPVGARDALAGRDHIVMGRWFPYDFEHPMVRLADDRSGRAAFEVFGVDDLAADVTGDDVRTTDVPPPSPAAASKIDGVQWVAITAKPGVHRYELRLKGKTRSGAPWQETRTGTLLGVQWQVTVFPWTHDPRQDVAAWRAEAKGPAAKTATTSALALHYGGGGPSQVGLSKDITEANLPADHFGTIAHTSLPLPAGRWRLRTTSDDGVRVLVDGKPVIENWTWHGPTTDTGEITLAEPRTVDVRVEHFELDGYSVLELAIEPVGSK